jgi:hypothetical protein
MGMTTALCTSDRASLTLPGLSFDDEGDVYQGGDPAMYEGPQMFVFWMYGARVRV